MLRDFLGAVVSVFLPAPCRACRATLTNASRIPICGKCLDSLRPFSGPSCQRCGRPLASAGQAGVATLLCHACRRNLYGFDTARSYGPYDPVMARAITLLKYEGVSPLGGWFAERLADMVAAEPALGTADAVVPVPLHPTRQRERGYNQAELIARPLARRLRLPLASYLLVRTKPRPDKLKLSRRERWQTVRGAYALRQGARVDKSSILLVDDVFTTGATLDACARALRDSGAARVVGLTVARAVAGAAAGQADAEESGGASRLEGGETGRG